MTANERRKEINKICAKCEDGEFGCCGSSLCELGWEMRLSDKELVTFMEEENHTNNL